MDATPHWACDYVSLISCHSAIDMNISEQQTICTEYGTCTFSQMAYSYMSTVITYDYDVHVCVHRISHCVIQCYVTLHVLYLNSRSDKYLYMGKIAIPTSTISCANAPKSTMAEHAVCRRYHSMRINNPFLLIYRPLDATDYPLLVDG